MRLAIITPQSVIGSTNVGRIFPLAAELAKQHTVHVLVHKSTQPKPEVNFTVHLAGRDPFTKTDSGKKRLAGVTLVARLKVNIILTVWLLLRLNPDLIIISKSLPESVAAAWLYSLVNRHVKFILDVDDFELTANNLTSLTQRAAVHWAERAGAKLADKIITATPFLSDHFEQLANDRKEIAMIPTGVADSGTTAGIRPEIPHTPKSLPRSEGIQNPQQLNLQTGHRILYLGSVSIASGHRIDLLPDILTAVRNSIPDAHLCIAGSGDDVKKIKAAFAARNLAAAVSWHGRFVSSEVPELLRLTNVVVDPVDMSITNRAKSSYRAALATAAGLPVVTSDIGIRPFLLPDELHRRCFADPADATSYAEKIINFLHQPLTADEQTRLRQHARTYTWSRLARTYGKLLI
ncbi:MAG: hypothetical protein COT71_00075 [Candidatus Andersenbacteria bacterium CG10_big_fil_rev_8_21_14_0_10_54_11]|uniref:Glycosyltransferase subfamily 4-like N-terminal domain-containing protein n=1 Tax=Candidatus Andersenbacteria bacterium CG10_big_fil_rev_8_21_14_0_10_54_11 TaxID=1974485 RepID=A0A2M6X0P0_9BACT|nr:MAG: hypothetical protein COT71_00075 [Candidatus Andersenbacteria bacterium CG10_big_fil_rev_8_21_14_0_10_54_11]